MAGSGNDYTVAVTIAKQIPTDDTLVLDWSRVSVGVVEMNSTTAADVITGTATRPNPLEFISFNILVNPGSKCCEGCCGLPVGIWLTTHYFHIPEAVKTS